MSECVVNATYRVRVREGAPKATQVLRVIDVPVLHISLLDLLFLHFGERCLFVHPATELICTLTLRPIHPDTPQIEEEEFQNDKVNKNLEKIKTKQDSSYLLDFPFSQHHYLFT